MKELSFLSSDASIIDGIESAKAMIAKVGESEENKDMQSFHLFLESQCSAKREEKNYKWRKADETVPAGWMIAPRSNMVRSPSGLYFVNRSNFEVSFHFFIVGVQASCTAAPDQRRGQLQRVGGRDGGEGGARGVEA